MRYLCSFSFFVLWSSVVLFGQVTAKLGTDFKKYGLNPSNSPVKWEDGIRTNGGRGTYEWWYFDTHLSDGSTAVIVFYTKHFNKAKKPLSPLITIDIEKPSGENIRKRVKFDAEEFSASKDSCNVSIGKNYFRGNLKHYDIHFEDNDLNLTASIDRTTESWRPKTGHMEFGENAEDFFAWVVPVPAGNVTLNYTYNGKSYKTDGACYHDHNWGNRIMIDVFNHWYWSRASIGPYNIITSEMIAEEDYNYESIIVYNISKNGKTVVDDESLVKAYRTYGKMHPTLHKDVSDELIFDYKDPKTGYRYEYSLYRQKNLKEVDLLLSAIGKKNLKYRLARLFTKFDGAYFRFTGLSEIKVYKDDKLIDSQSSNNAIWELMYFGHLRQ